MSTTDKRPDAPQDAATDLAVQDLRTAAKFFMGAPTGQAVFVLACAVNRFMLKWR